jgi:hypothetical protein
MPSTAFHAIFKKARTLLTVLGLSAVSYNSYTQTILHTEDFESGSPNVILNTLDLGGILTGENPWTINNIYLGGVDLILCVPPVPLIIPPTPPQPGGITNSPNSTYLHVTPQTALSIGGLLPASSYTVGDGICLLGNQSTFSGMSSDISTIGHDSVTLDLWWMCGGSELYYGEVYYSTDGGAGWTPVINPLNGTNKWFEQVLWTNTIITDPNWDAQSTLRFGFRFITGSGVTGAETNPGFSIDDMTITGYDVCTPTSSSIAPEVCDAYTSPSGDSTWTQSGVYMDTIQNVEGCDSIITIDLTVNHVDISVSQDDTSLTANASPATYQWLDCDDGHIAITFATNQTFATIMDGSYAVVVSQHGCVDTSGCTTVFGLGLDDFDPGSILLQPNPAHDQVTVIVAPLQAGFITIVDLPGRALIHQPLQPGTTEIALDEIQLPGIYLVKITDSEGTLVSVTKLVVE